MLLELAAGCLVLAMQADDVVQTTDGRILVGQALHADTAKVEFLLKGQVKPRILPAREIEPYSLYKLLLDRTDKNDGPARFALGEFCMTRGLYSTAQREFEKAAQLDPSLAETCGKRTTEAHHEEARARFEEAKRRHVEKKYDDARRILRTIVDKFADTPYYEEARKELDKIAEETQPADTTPGRVEELLKEALKHWDSALEREPRDPARAEQDWKAAEAALVEARKESPGESSAQVDILLAKTYYRLGRLAAAASDYDQALTRLNQSLKVPPDTDTERLVNDLLLAVTQERMRRAEARPEPPSK